MGLYFEKFTVAFSVSYFIMMFVTISAVPVPFVEGDDPHFGSNRMPPLHHRMPENSHHLHRSQRSISPRERPIPQDHRDFQNRRPQIPRPIPSHPDNHHSAPLPRSHNKRRREAEQFGDRSFNNGWRFRPEQEEEHFSRNRRASRDDQRDFDFTHPKSQKHQEENKNSVNGGFSIPAVITFKGDGIKIKNNVDLVNIEIDTSDDSDETNLEVVDDQ